MSKFAESLQFVQQLISKKCSHIVNVQDDETILDSTIDNWGEPERAPWLREQLDRKVRPGDRQRGGASREPERPPHAWLPVARTA